MDITQVKIFPVEEEKLKAFVSVVFDHCFMVNDIKVIEGKDGLFLSMPSRRKRSGEFKDVAHPLNNETRRRIEEHVLADYRKVVDDPTPRRPDRVPEGDDPQAKTAETAEETPQETPQKTPQESPRRGAEKKPQPEPEPQSLPQAEAEAESRSAAEEEPQPPVATDAPDAPAEPEETEQTEEPEAQEDSLGEVQEKHLKDSFWQVG